MFHAKAGETSAEIPIYELLEQFELIGCQIFEEEVSRVVMMVYEAMI